MTDVVRDEGADVEVLPDEERRSWPVRDPLEGVLWMVAGVIVSWILTWPLARNLSTVVPNDAADPLAEAWEAAWGGYAVLHRTTSVFSANTFWPEGPSLAFSDSLIGYFPAALVGSGPVAAVVRYNLLFLFAYALAFAGAGLLARELGVRPAAAAVAAAGFAWAPWRMSHNGHLNILSTGGIPLALFLLLSGYRRGRTWQIVAGWLVAAWQVSLGFGLGIYFCYLLAVIAVGVVVDWLRRGRPSPARATVLGTAVGGSSFFLVVAVCVSPYLTVLRRYPDAPRGRAEVEFYSPPGRGLLAASEQNRVWGHATEFVRATLPWSAEQALFPGLTVCVLAALGLFWRRSSVRLRVVLGVTLIAGVILSLGLRPYSGTFTYGPLYDLLPGWNGLRTPGRLAVFWSLALALLAALGAQRLSDAGSQRIAGRGVQRAIAAGAISVGCALLVLYEGSPRLPLAPVPIAPPGLAAVADPQVHFPASPFDDDAYMLWSTDGFPRISNGSTSYLPPVSSTIRGLTAFPDAASVDYLRSQGFRSVLLHTDRAPGTPWADAASRPIEGLGITRDTIGSVIVYDLGGS